MVQEKLVVTPEEIIKHYSAAMDSVNLINSLLSITEKTDVILDVIKRNVQHLEIMVAKDYWTTEDLTPLTNAIAVGKL